MIRFRALAGPVLKHGPRSLACVRVIELTRNKTERRNESEGARSPCALGGWSSDTPSDSRTPEASRFQSVNAGAL